MIRKLIPFLLLASCSTKPKVPKEILSPEKMEAITWDLIRADGILTHTVAADSTTSELDKRAQMYQQVLQLHGITKEAYKRSLRFYESRPDLLKLVFTAMSDRASKPPALTKDSTRKDTILK